jgi:hypothetical protein
MTITTLWFLRAAFLICLAAGLWEAGLGHNQGVAERFTGFFFAAAVAAIVCATAWAIGSVGVFLWFAEASP